MSSGKIRSMNLVAFDTSTEACSVAVQVGDEVRFDHRLVQREHAALLLPMLQGLLSEFALLPHQLDGVVFGRGPGSFTGVRIAAATAQGLALAADCGVHGVSSLQSMALACARIRRGEGKSTAMVMAAIDARMNQIYTNVYRSVGDETQPMPGSLGALDAATLSWPMELLELADERVVEPENCLLQLDNAAFQPASPISDRVLCGSGAEVYEAKIRRAFDSLGGVQGATIELQHGVFPHAQDLLALTPSNADASWKSPEHAQPIYLRNKVAKTLAERTSN